METNDLGFVASLLFILVPAVFLIVLYIQTSSRQGGALAGHLAQAARHMKRQTAKWSNSQAACALGLRRCRWRGARRNAQRRTQGSCLRPARWRGQQWQSLLTTSEKRCKPDSRTNPADRNNNIDRTAEPNAHAWLVGGRATSPNGCSQPSVAVERLAGLNKPTSC